MLDVLSDGRLDFGIGRGVLKAEYELFDVAESESHGRYHESVEIILQAWTQDTVTYDGKYYKIRDVKALPKPVQQPHPPIWSACAVTPESFTFAGHKGFNPMIVPFAYPRHEDLQGEDELLLVGSQGGRTRSLDARSPRRLSSLRRRFRRGGSRARQRPLLRLLEVLQRAR